MAMAHASSVLVLVVIMSATAMLASALEINRLPGHHKQKRAGEVGDMYGHGYPDPYLLYWLRPYYENLQAYHGGSAYYDYNNRYAQAPPGPAVHKECEAYEPFRCPGKRPGRGNPEGVVCISIQYLCDGAPDCPTGYDEDPRLCTAAKRPPVEETASFLQSLLASHGPNYLEKLFGPKARNALYDLNGVQGVAVALSESQTIDDFGNTLSLASTDVDHLRSVFMAVENGDIGMLKSLGIKDSELGDVKFFLEKLVNTGFLD